MAPRSVSMGTRMNQQQSAGRRCRLASRFSEGAQGDNLAGINNQAGAFDSWNAHIRYFLARYPLESRQFVAQRLATYGVRALLSSYRQEDLTLDVLASATDGADRDVLTMMKQHARRRREMQQNAGWAPASGTRPSFVPPARAENRTSNPHRRSALAATAVAQASVPGPGVANGVLREREATGNVEVAAARTHAPAAKANAAKQKPAVAARADVLVRYPFIDDLTGVEGGGVREALHRATPNVPLQNLAKREIRRLAHGVFRELKASAHGIRLSDLPSALQALFFGDSASLLTANGHGGAAPELRQRKPPDHATPDIRLVTTENLGLTEACLAAHVRGWKEDHEETCRMVPLQKVFPLSIDRLYTRIGTLSIDVRLRALAREALPPTLAFAARDTSTLSSASTHGGAAGSLPWSEQTLFISESRWIKVVAHVVRRLWEMDGTVVERYGRQRVVAKSRVVASTSPSPAAGPPHVASLLESSKRRFAGNADIVDAIGALSPGSSQDPIRATGRLVGDGKSREHEDGMSSLSRALISARDQPGDEVHGAVELEPGWAKAADIAGGLSSSSTIGDSVSITNNGTGTGDVDDQDNVLVDDDVLAAPSYSDLGNANPEDNAGLTEAWEHAEAEGEEAVRAWVGAGHSRAWVNRDMETPCSTSTPCEGGALSLGERKEAGERFPVSSTIAVAANIGRQGLTSGTKEPATSATAQRGRGYGGLNPVRGAPVEKEGTRPAGMWEVTPPSHVAVVRRGGKQRSGVKAAAGREGGREIPAYLRGVQSKIGAQVEEHRHRARRIANERNAAVRDAVARRRLDGLEGRTTGRSPRNAEGEEGGARAPEQDLTKRPSTRGHSPGEYALDIAEAFLESSLMTRLTGGDWFDVEDEESVSKRLSSIWEPDEAVKTRSRYPAPAASINGRYTQTERANEERKASSSYLAQLRSKGYSAEGGPDASLPVIAEYGALRGGAGEQRRAYTGWLGDYGASHTHTVREGALPGEGSEGETEEETKQIPAQEERGAELNLFEMSETCGAKEQRDHNRGEVEDVEGGTAERNERHVGEKRGEEPCGQSLREKFPIIPGETTEAHADAPDQILGGGPGSPLLSGDARSSASATPLPEAATALGSSIITTVSGRRSMSSGASGTAIRDRSLSPRECANVDIDETAECDESFGNSAAGSSLGIQEDHVAAPIDADFEAYLHLAVDDVIDSAGCDEGACVTREDSTGGGGGSTVEGMPALVSGGGSDRSTAGHSGPSSRTGSWWKDDTSVIGPVEALDGQRG